VRNGGALWQLDVLVNNAGTTTFVPHDQLDALTEEIWLRTLRVNLIGAFMMSREAAPHIEAAGGGEIIMTSSIASMTANGSSIAYCASKAGMNSLTRTLAKTLGKKKIRVNAVLPGLIDGDWAFNTWGGGDAEQYEGLKKMFSDQTPPEDGTPCGHGFPIGCPADHDFVAPRAYHWVWLS
jgi:3-oxoacyl-[acyl-carrier protein] reductase